MVLKNHVINNFNGILSIGDVHADYELFEQAINYAETHNYFLISLGDLVDRGSSPFKVVEKMSQLVSAKKAAMTIGNHDDKFGRYAAGAKVLFSYEAKLTLENVGLENYEEFFKNYEIVLKDTEFSAIYHNFGNIIFVHGASHESMWDTSLKFNSEAQRRALYGEVNGEKYPDGFPVRQYNWIDDIPFDKTVIVGHDRAPIHNVLISEPMHITNKNGGKVIFTDTGCGKDGYLSGVVILYKDNKFIIDNIVSFKHS